ncbi:hypothetical protein GH714_040729 [Hevea brasiliensis]|uniref:Acyltransferase C-terminal domain-containing protein n=1 Tax=Hevea brasiliensis TaxID=3981 RepID=A0A6A6MRU8_HEVBR|nr:hypothetical protein GH714_040729 [Hevea brasiliensis]
MTLSALQGFKHCLAEHPSIVNFRWSITQTWGSTWFFIFSAIAIYIAASVTLHILLSLLLSRSRRVSLGPIPAIHSLTMALISAFIFIGLLFSTAAEIRDTRWFWPRTRTTTAFQWLLCFPLGTRSTGRVFFWVAKGTFPFCSELAGCSFGLQSTLPFWSAFLAFLERWVQWDGSLGLKLCIEWRDSAVVFEVLREVTFDKEEGQHALWPFLFEKINGAKVVFYGDAVPAKERVLIIANHRTEVDRMYLWDLALRKGCLGSIYDLSIAYKHQCPTFLDNVFGVDPAEVHIHIRRIPVKDIPDSDSEAASWLMNTFQLKDQLLSDFETHGHFPNEGTEGELSTLKCMANFTMSKINNLDMKLEWSHTMHASNLANATVFTLQNLCSYTIWPGTLSGNGAATLGDGGFVLPPGSSIQFQAPPIGPEVAPPVTLAEFTIATNPTDKDFYDVSLVDGYNLGLGVKALGGSGDCQYAGCLVDLNVNCPAELQMMDSGSIVACKSACAAFNSPEFCCTGDHSTPQTCPPTKYSALFKNACPTAYSYAYDDASSTCTCSGSDYLITFCSNGSG